MFDVNIQFHFISGEIFALIKICSKYRVTRLNADAEQQ